MSVRWRSEEIVKNVELRLLMPLLLLLISLYYYYYYHCPWRLRTGPDILVYDYRSGLWLWEWAVRVVPEHRGPAELAPETRHDRHTCNRPLCWPHFWHRYVAFKDSSILYKSERVTEKTRERERERERESERNCGHRYATKQEIFKLFEFKVDIFDFFSNTFAVGLKLLTECCVKIKQSVSSENLLCGQLIWERRWNFIS